MTKGNGAVNQVVGTQSRQDTNVPFDVNPHEGDRELWQRIWGVLDAKGHSLKEGQCMERNIKDLLLMLSAVVR